MNQDPRALTVTGNGLLRELRTEIQVGTPMVDLSQMPTRIVSGVSAIWDTGATNSVITQRIVDELGILAISFADVHGVGGIIEKSPVYLASVLLPMGVGLPWLNVTLGDLPPGCDVLLGMDVIGHGDFVITNKNGITKMSFRVPSMTSTDYVIETNKQNVLKRKQQSRQRLIPGNTKHR